MIARGEAVLADLISIIGNLMDWECADGINRESWLFADLRFESIKTLSLMEALNQHYDRKLPFEILLAEMAERQQRDIQVKDLEKFLRRQL